PPRGPLAAARIAQDDEPDYSTYRQRYLALQQSMENQIAKLRGRLRATLATQAPEKARLAMVDAIMERSLILQERRMLSTIPGLLEGHFQRLRRAALAEQEQNGDAPPPARLPPWLARFRQDMRSVLLAELDIRLQPIEGLLAAVRGN
ncbi:DUF3348 family protein, partial [Bordetella petrii]|uniref:DUF3348 family protein n=1 Tax=Bordetella petrii TaxID=94624 RepID=UPI001E40E779